MADTPFSRYFTPKQGQWSGAFHFTLTRWRALLSSPVGLFDRVSVLSLAALCGLFGPLSIETSVEVARLHQGEVLHTTRISRWGLTLYRSVERFLVDTDGRRLKVEGEQWSLPWRWRPRRYQESRGEISEDGARASYLLSWLGASLRQESTPEGPRLRFTQDTDWSHADFILTKR